ncbi:MAG: hypothetical protein ACI91F_003700 [Candidatus Binatia bacterium]|jgi:hypothetical protein
MFRLVFTLAGVVLIGLGAGYFMWGSRVANLTESLNSMVLEQETLRARLATAAPAGPAPAAGVAGGDAGGDQAMASADEGAPTLVSAVGALKDEVQYQAKLIDEQTHLINRMLEASERAGGAGMQTCQENMQVLTGQLQRCRGDVDQLKSRLGGAAGVPGAVNRLPSAPRPPVGQYPGQAQPRGVPVPPPY